MIREEVFLGDWLVQPSIHRLVRGSTECRLEPRIMGVLLCLLDQPGELVERSEIMATVWEGVIVEDIAVSQAVSRIRKILGDSPKKPVYIETVPKRGYRLIAPVRKVVAQREPVAGMRASLLARLNRPRTRVAGVLGGAMFLIVSLLAFSGEQTRPIYSTSSVVPVSTSQALKINPSLSPNGEVIVFAARTPGQRWLNLYTSGGEGTSVQRLTRSSTDDVSPAWSPDGTAIAFVRLVSGSCQVVMLSTLSGRERDIGSCDKGSDSQVGWWPSGKALVLSHRPAPDTPYRLSLMTLRDGSLRQLTFPPAADVGDRFPSVAPDGGEIGFARVRQNGKGSIMTLSVSTGEEQWLSENQDQISGLSWSAHDGQIYFSSLAQGSRSLWRIDGSNRAPELVLAGASSPSTARDVGNLAFMKYAVGSDIWTASTSEQEGVLIVESDAWKTAPQISPDGQSVAYISNEDGFTELWVADKDGASAQQLTHFGAASVARPRWSPGGRDIVFDAQIENGAAVFRVGLDDLRVERLTDYQSDNIGGSWSRDGAWIYFGSNRGGEWHVWRIPAFGGAPVQVISAPSTLAQEGADGELYYSYYAGAGLWRHAPESDEDPRVATKPVSPDWWNWSVGDEGLYYLNGGGQATVEFVAYGTSQVREIATLQDPARTETVFSISEDGTQLVYARATKMESRLMLLFRVPDGSDLNSSGLPEDDARIARPARY